MDEDSRARKAVSAGGADGPPATEGEPPTRDSSPSTLQRRRLDYRRVQRPTPRLPVLHLESEMPSADPWTLEVAGLVRDPTTWTLGHVRSMNVEERVWDLHCVWGWSHPRCRWEGVPAVRLIDETHPDPEARFALVRAREGSYASCLTIEEARSGLIAWRLDGSDLRPEHGGPLRFVPPPTKWGYKGVKWLGGIELTAQRRAGFWETLVGDLCGDIPPEMMDLTWE